MEYYLVSLFLNTERPAEAPDFAHQEHHPMLRVFRVNHEVDPVHDTEMEGLAYRFAEALADEERPSDPDLAEYWTAYRELGHRAPASGDIVSIDYGSFGETADFVLDTRAEPFGISAIGELDWSQTIPTEAPDCDRYRKDQAIRAVVDEHFSGPQAAIEAIARLYHLDPPSGG
jgi:hypothetical protein